MITEWEALLFKPSLTSKAKPPRHPLVPAHPNEKERGKSEQQVEHGSYEHIKL